MSVHEITDGGPRGLDKDAEANSRAMLAVKRIHALDASLQQEFKTLEENRKVLREHGIKFEVKFSDVIEAALSKYRNEPFWER